MFNINEFKANGMKFGARPSQFKVDIFVPIASTTTPRIQFFCRAASIPPAPLDTVPAPYFGREIQLAGDRTFPPWTVTIDNEHDFDIRVLMESWSNKINTLVSNRVDPTMFPTGYKSEALVTQYRADGSEIRVYRFEGIFPINVDAIPLDWGAKNQYESFDVTFAYDLWVPDSSSPANVNEFSPILEDDGFET